MDRKTGCIYGPDENPIMVCGEHAFCYGEGTEEALANNYLFWAAPDLLEASGDLVQWLNGVGLTNKSRRNRIPAKLLDNLEAAISKTEKKP